MVNKNFRSHKRQKSSLLNVGYYFESPQHQNHHGQSSTHPSPIRSNVQSSPVHSLQQSPMQASGSATNMGQASIVLTPTGRDVASGTTGFAGGGHSTSLQNTPLHHTSVQETPIHDPINHPIKDLNPMNVPQLSPTQTNLHQTHSQSTQSPSHSQGSPTMEQSIYDVPYINYNFSQSDQRPTGSTLFHYPITQSSMYNPIDANSFASSSQFQPLPPNVSSASMPSNVPPSIATASTTNPLTAMSQSSLPTNLTSGNLTGDTTGSSSSLQMPRLPQSLAPSVQSSIPSSGPLQNFDFYNKSKQHKANLSISSHFNLFNLNEDDPKRQISNNLTNDLLVKLINVDGATVNNFLMLLLYKLNYPVPLDDFYNLLYNNNTSLLFNFSDKIDKTSIGSNSQISLDMLNQILEVFKRPDSLVQYFPSLNKQENRLANINYHELLRTFLAVKILSDMLIQIPKERNKDLTKYNIPRLSLYKTYYIICQKLLLKYPSSLTSSNEHHKLILGQSKLGKLIKVVYPDLMIKRLGSRGESKYNYLGVMWNDNIIDDEIADLCNNHELVDLGQIFDRQSASKYEMYHGNTTGDTIPPTDVSSSANLATIGGPIVPPGTASSSLSAGSGSHKRKISLPKSPVEIETASEYFQPQLSFISTGLKYPAEFNTADLNWINNIKFNLLQDPDFNDVSIEFIIKDIFITSSGSLTDLSLLFNEKLINHIDLSEFNIDLKLYLVVLLELIPMFLMIQLPENLKYFKINLLKFIDTFDNENLNQNNLRIFKILIKKLINLNDLLLSLIKVTLCKSEDLINDIEKVFNNNLDFLSNNLINSLISYNFDPTTNNNLLNLTFINQEIIDIKRFFLVDLINYLKKLKPMNKEPSIKPESFEIPSSDHQDFNLSSNEYINLLDLIQLIDQHLLTPNFKSNYPILIFNNFISLVANDLVKLVYFRQQDQKLPYNHFNNWFVLNSFIEEYLNLMGELVGLNNNIYG